MRTFFDTPSFPDERLQSILSFIKPNKISRLATVSKKFYSQSNDNYLWTQFYTAEFGALSFPQNAKIQYFAAALFREAENCTRTDNAQLLYQKLHQLIKPYDLEPWTHFYNGKLRYNGLGLSSDKLLGLWYYKMNFQESVEEIASLFIELDAKNRKLLLKDLAVIELIVKLLDTDPFLEIEPLIDMLREQGLTISHDIPPLKKMEGKKISDLSIKDLGMYLKKNVSLQNFDTIIQNSIQQVFSTLIEKYDAGSSHLAHQIGKLYTLDGPFTNYEEAEQWLKKAMLKEPEAVYDYLSLLPQDERNKIELSLQIPEYENIQAIMNYNLGHNLAEEGKISAAIEKFVLAAEAGYLPAKTSLGEMYYHLHTTEKDDSGVYYQMAVEELFSAFTAGEPDAGEVLYAMLDDFENYVNIDLFKQSFFAGNWQAVRQIGQFYTHLLLEDHIKCPTNILWIQLASQYSGKKPFPILERLVKERNPYACVALGILYTYGICDSSNFQSDARKGELYCKKALEFDLEIGYHYLELVQEEVSRFEGVSLNDLLLPEIEMKIKQQLIDNALDESASPPQLRF